MVGLEIWTAAGKCESSLIRLPAGGSKTITDVVKTTFGLEQTFGTLLVSSTGNVIGGGADLGAGVRRRDERPVRPRGRRRATSARPPSSARARSAIFPGSGRTRPSARTSASTTSARSSASSRSRRATTPGASSARSSSSTRPPHPVRPGSAREPPPGTTSRRARSSVTNATSGCTRRGRRLRHRQRDPGPLRRHPAQEALIRRPDGRARGVPVGLPVGLDRAPRIRTSLHRRVVDDSPAGGSPHEVEEREARGGGLVGVGDLPAGDDGDRLARPSSTAPGARTSTDSISNESVPRAAASG